MNNAIRVRFQEQKWIGCELDEYLVCSVLSYIHL